MGSTPHSDTPLENRLAPSTVGAMHDVAKAILEIPKEAAPQQALKLMRSEVSTDRKAVRSPNKLELIVSWLIRPSAGPLHERLNPEPTLGGRQAHAHLREG